MSSSAPVNLRLVVAPPPTTAYARISRTVPWDGPLVTLPSLVGARQLGRAALEDEIAFAELLAAVRRPSATKNEHDVEVLNYLRSAAKTAARLWLKRPA